MHYFYNLRYFDRREGIFCPFSGIFFRLPWQRGTIFKNFFGIFKAIYISIWTQVIDLRILRVIKSETFKCFYLVSEVSLIKYIRYKNIQMECREPLYKKVAYVQVIFILEHFDWVLCIISECDCINYFKFMASLSLKKNFEYVLRNSKNSD